ncbi:MAG: STAS-like domain-containing protein [Xenococcaceae cyanobacterium]
MNSPTSSQIKRDNALRIKVHELVPESGFLAEHHGQKVYELIEPAFKEGKMVILSFENMERLTWSFITKAIAQFYEFFPEEQIQAQLSLVDIQPKHQAFIEKVIKTKKEYLRDPEQLKKPLSDEERELLRQQNPNNPWLEMAGIFKDDPQFDQMLEYIAEYRRKLDAEMEAYYAQLDAEEEAK